MSEFDIDNIDFFKEEEPEKEKKKFNELEKKLDELDKEKKKLDELDKKLEREKQLEEEKKQKEKKPQKKQPKKPRVKKEEKIDTSSIEIIEKDPSICLLRSIHEVLFNKTNRNLSKNDLKSKINTKLAGKKLFLLF